MPHIAGHGVSPKGMSLGPDGLPLPPPIPKQFSPTKSPLKSGMASELIEFMPFSQMRRGEGSASGVTAGGVDDLSRRWPIGGKLDPETGKMTGDYSEAQAYWGNDIEEFKRRFGGGRPLLNQGGDQPPMPFQGFDPTQMERPKGMGQAATAVQTPMAAQTPIYYLSSFLAEEGATDDVAGGLNLSALIRAATAGQFSPAANNMVIRAINKLNASLFTEGGLMSQQAALNRELADLDTDDPKIAQIEAQLRVLDVPITSLQAEEQRLRTIYIEAVNRQADFDEVAKDKAGGRAISAALGGQSSFDFENIPSERGVQGQFLTQNFKLINDAKIKEAQAQGVNQAVIDQQQFQRAAEFLNLNIRGLNVSPEALQAISKEVPSGVLGFLSGLVAPIQERSTPTPAAPPRITFR
jgi:hypothetical protein